ncbi:hypothetical protein RUM44_005693 [Polyplax serrata]|uniref:Uncharacterized protein n=1 Tax=Polyplax serrata TaxID=468196 RepID=A0ABR1AWP1_POLSC
MLTCEVDQDGEAQILLNVPSGLTVMATATDVLRLCFFFHVSLEAYSRECRSVETPFLNIRSEEKTFEALGTLVKSEGHKYERCVQEETRQNIRESNVFD